MNGLIKTNFSLRNDLLLKDGNQTGIRIEDEYFYRGDLQLPLYIEDNYIFQLRPLFGFIPWIKFSKWTGLKVDASGDVWSDSSVNAWPAGQIF